MSDAWAAVERLGRSPIASLFETEPDRLDHLTLDACGLHFDFSKTHLSAAHLDAFAVLAEAQDLAGARETLFTGGLANPTEGRAAEHTAERGEGAAGSV